MAETRDAGGPGSGAVAGGFMAFSEVSIALDAGAHRIVVEIVSGDGETSSIGADVRINGATPTLPPTDAGPVGPAGPTAPAVGWLLLLCGGAAFVVDTGSRAVLRSRRRARAAASEDHQPGGS